MQAYFPIIIKHIRKRFLLFVLNTDFTDWLAEIEVGVQKLVTLMTRIGYGVGITSFCLC